MYGICNLSIVPCRVQPFHKSEMVTQLLFGEHFKILAEEEKWVLIKVAYDDYECWIDKKQFTKISQEEFNLLNNESQKISFEILKKIGKIDNIVLGSILPDFKKRKFRIAENEYSFKGKIILPKRKPNRKNIISTAKMYLNTPYLWGGRSPFGIDCSGFTQMVFKLNGIKLPRDAHQQAEIGKTLNFIEEAQKGDLAFFDNQEGKIIHTGIIISTPQLSPKEGEQTRKAGSALGNSSLSGRFGGASIIHSSGKVRIDTLDHYGIFNTETGRYSHNLRLIKRIF